MSSYKVQRISRPQLLRRHVDSSEQFGNSHEYELLDQNHDVNNTVALESWDHYQKLNRLSTASGELPYAQSRDDYNIGNIVDSVLFPRNTSVDDRMYQYTSNNTLKSKKSMEYRSGMTSDKFKRFFANELDTHAHRVWWEDTDYEHSKKHVMF